MSFETFYRQNPDPFAKRPDIEQSSIPPAAKYEISEGQDWRGKSYEKKADELNQPAKSVVNEPSKPAVSQSPKEEVSQTPQAAVSQTSTTAVSPTPEAATSKASSTKNERSYMMGRLMGLRDSAKELASAAKTSTLAALRSAFGKPNTEEMLKKMGEEKNAKHLPLRFNLATLDPKVDKGKIKDIYNEFRENKNNYKNLESKLLSTGETNASVKAILSICKTSYDVKIMQARLDWNLNNEAGISQGNQPNPFKEKLSIEDSSKNLTITRAESKGLSELGLSSVEFFKVVKDVKTQKELDAEFDAMGW